MRRAAHHVAIVAIAATLSAAAKADDDSDAARAAQLFEEGRTLMADQNTLSQGCEKLAESHALKPRGDTLLNLAECHRREGKTATAWREFDEAIRYAKEVEFVEALKVAETLRDQLARSLSALIINVPPTPKIEVVLDGKPLPSQQWGVRLYVDPGVHTVTAAAEGYEPFKGETEVKLGTSESTIQVSMKALPLPPKPTPPTPIVIEHPFPVWAVVLGGAGIAMLATSVIFGVDTFAAGDELDTQCGEGREACPSEYDFEGDRSRELRSFGLFVGFGIGGLIATGVGAVGLGLGLSSNEPSASPPVAVVPWVSGESGGIAIGGRF
jgi:hypothetical protein